MKPQFATSDRKKGEERDNSTSLMPQYEMIVIQKDTSLLLFSSNDLLTVTKFYS